MGAVPGNENQDPPNRNSATVTTVATVPNTNGRRPLKEWEEKEGKKYGSAGMDVNTYRGLHKKYEGSVPGAELKAAWQNYRLHRQQMRKVRPPPSTPPPRKRVGGTNKEPASTNYCSQQGRKNELVFDSLSSCVIVGSRN